MTRPRRRPSPDDGRDPWLADFSLVLKLDFIRQVRGNPDYEAFTGSKAAPFPGLLLVGFIAGGLGGVAVSAALWSLWWQVPLWLIAFASFVYAVRRVVVATCVPPIGFLAGWCLFFGVMMGVFTLWGAQLSSTAWCYGITGAAVFFLLGITGGNVEPANSKSMEDWFVTSAVTAPLSSCLAAWIYRNWLSDPDSLLSAALMGALAATPFLAVTMALHLLAWKPERALAKLASLYLHNDEFLNEAKTLFDAALKVDPDNPVLLTRRGLAHALTGEQTAAEGDWTRAEQIDPGTHNVKIARGWVALRRDDPVAALTAFNTALPPKKRDRVPLIGLALAHDRLGDPAVALNALKRVRAKDHTALSLTYLAQAHLQTGDAAAALSTATYAIEEADSIHGRSWLVRAEAQRALGRIDAAAQDYNRAFWAADEIGIEDRALAGLKQIDRPVSEEDAE